VNCDLAAEVDRLWMYMTAIVVARDMPDIIITNTKYIPDQRTNRSHVALWSDDLNKNLKPIWKEAAFSIYVTLCRPISPSIFCFLWGSLIAGPHNMVPWAPCTRSTTPNSITIESAVVLQNTHSSPTDMELSLHQRCR